MSKKTNYSPDKITLDYLKRSSLFHLQKFDTTAQGLRQVLTRRVHKNIRNSDRKISDFEHLIDQAITHCVDQNYINDKRYAERYISLATDRGDSKRKAVMKLAEKGVARSIVDEILEEFPISDWESALNYARKKKIGKFRTSDQIKNRQKDLARLARQGFSYQIAQDIIGCDSDEDYET